MKKQQKITRGSFRILASFFGIPLPILRVVAATIGKIIQKEPSEALSLLETIWNEGSFEARQIAGKCLEKFAPKNPEISLDFVSSVLPDLDNGAVCDNLAMFGVEPIVYSNPELVLPLSEKWINEAVPQLFLTPKNSLLFGFRALSSFFCPFLNC